MWIYYLSPPPKKKVLKYFQGKIKRLESVTSLLRQFILKYPQTNAHIHKRGIVILIPPGSIPTRGSLQVQVGISECPLLCSQAKFTFKTGCGNARDLPELTWTLDFLWITSVMKVWCRVRSRGSRVTKPLVWILPLKMIILQLTKIK